MSSNREPAGKRLASLDWAAVERAVSSGRPLTASASTTGVVSRQARRELANLRSSIRVDVRDLQIEGYNVALRLSMAPDDVALLGPAPQVAELQINGMKLGPPRLSPLRSSSDERGEPRLDLILEAEASESVRARLRHFSAVELRLKIQNGPELIGFK